MIPKLQFSYYPDRAAAIAALQRGQILALAGLRADEAASAGAARRLHGSLGATGGTDDAPVQPQPVRSSRIARHGRALIGRSLTASSWSSQALHGKAIARSAFSQHFVARRSADQPAATSLTASRALIEQAGWVDGNRDGVRDGNGIRLEFGLLTTITLSGLPLRGQWRRRGRSLAPQLRCRSSTPGSLVTDYLQPRRFEAALFG